LPIAKLQFKPRFRFRPTGEIAKRTRARPLTICVLHCNRSRRRAHVL